MRQVPGRVAVKNVTPHTGTLQSETSLPPGY